MLGADARVVEPGRDTVRIGDLPALILQHIRVCAVQDAGAAGLERGGVVAKRRAATAGFDADQLHRSVIQKRGERAHRVRPAADAGNHPVG